MILKKLPLDSMFNLVKEHHKKFVELNKLVPRTKDKNKKKEILIIVGEIYNKFYDIYKSKYAQFIDTLSAKN